MRRRVTLFRIAAHEFHRSLRAWHSVFPAKELFKSLLDERAKALKTSMQSLTLAIIGTFWLAANKTELTLKIQLLDVTVPAGYVNFGVSVLLFGSVLQMINYFVLNDFVLVAAKKLFKFDNSSALIVPLDGSGAWSLGWLRQYRFISSTKGHQFAGLAVLLLMLTPLLMIWFLAYWNVFSIGLTVIGRDGIGSATGAFNAAGLSLTSFPIVLWVLLSVPFKFERNASYVRWLFLTKIYRREGRWPPRVATWVESKG